MLDSGGIKVRSVKIYENIFPPQAAELDLSPFGAVKLEIRRLLSNLKSGREAGSRQKEGEPQNQSQ